MDANELIHAQLVKAGVTLAATLPDDWVNGLIRRVTAGNQIKHIPVGREAETIAICAGAFFGGVRSVAIMGNTGLLTCTGEMATLCLRHMIPVFCIVSARGSIDDHKVYQEVQGRRTMKVRMGNMYIPRLQSAAAKDGVLSEAFLRAAGLVDPPTALMRPAIISRVLRPRAS